MSNERTEFVARSAGTATKISSAPISITGRVRVEHRQHPTARSLFLTVFLAMTGSLLLEPAARDYESSKLLNGIAAGKRTSPLTCT